MLLGKFHNAAYLAGGIRDQGNAFGASDTNTKAGNTVSYTYSTEALSFQIDAIMDGAKDTGKTIDEAQFGMSINLGDIGTVAIGYENAEDSMKEVMLTAHIADGQLTFTDDGKIDNFDDIVWRHKDDPGMVYEGEIKTIYWKDGYNHREVITSSDSPTLDGTVTIKKVKGKWYENSDACLGTERNEPTNVCNGDNMAYYLVKKTAPTSTNLNNADNGNTYNLQNPNMIDDAGTGKGVGIKDYGYKRSHISAVFGLGGIDLRLGHTTTDSNNPVKTKKAKINFLGVTGDIGDTGMDFRVYGRNKEDHDGKETKPWGVGVGKALGGGAYAYIEHENADDDNDGSTRIALNIDF